MFFWWLNPVRFYSLYKIRYPKRRIESYSIMGTIVSPNKPLITQLSVSVELGMSHGDYRGLL